MWSRKSRTAAAAGTCAAAPSSQHSRLLQLLAKTARPELAEQLAPHYRDVCASDGVWSATSQQLPIVYDAGYNITLWGIEKLHPFDSCKFEKVVKGLGLMSPQQLVRPLPASQQALSGVHSSEYLRQLHSSSRKVAEVTELAPLALLPHCLVQAKVLDPMRLHVGGTVLAAGLAMVRGWAVNLGGGMHHAHHDDGSGWCPYADIQLAVQRIRAASGGAVRRVLVVDLDAHQGNGLERDKLAAADDDLFIVDAYNCAAFPRDKAAKAAINIKVELQPGTGDAHYLAALAAALDRAAAEFPLPQLLVYNAGTDILAGDDLGRLHVSSAAVVQRDAAVFALAAERLRCPLVMLLSGGYSQASAGVIVESLASLLGSQQQPAAGALAAQ